ncbi:hypothetical protein M885DRAFT_510077 [Pelagophyceae sp. CCMP2097]|nr:hypothetical protein M885DRAFT_510077 [Pelagophyceae sp. CCMP2097]
MRACVVLSTLACCAAVDTLFDDAPGVQRLQPKTLEAISKNRQDAWIVNFYAPWCGHCQHYAPTWKAVGAALSGTTRVHVGVLSCAAHGAACGTFGVKGYPTVKAFGELDAEGSTKGRIVQGQRLGQILHFLASELDDPQLATLDARSKDDEADGEATAPHFSEVVSSRRPPALADAAASLMYTLEFAVFPNDASGPNDTLSPTKLIALRGVVATLAVALPDLTLASDVLVCFADPAHQRTLTHGVWSAWLSSGLRNCTKAAHKKEIDETKPSAPQWTTRCDPNDKGADGPAYTCGLWALFHSLTVSDRVAPAAAAACIRAVVDHFFACAPCREHFLKMYDGCAHGRCDSAENDSAALPLWLWRTHNAVNARVHGGAAGADVSDAAASWAWPSRAQCKTCVQPATTNEWDAHEVELYLRRTYGKRSATVRRRLASAPRTSG